MNFHYINEAQKANWEHMVSGNSANGFMQSFFWAEFKRLMGWDTFKIGAFNKEQLLGGAIIHKFNFSKTKNFLYIPEGPVLPYKDDKKSEAVFHALIGEIDKIVDLKGPALTTHLRIDPHLTSKPRHFAHFRKSPFNMQPKSTIMVDLKQSEEKILAGMKPKCRYNIKIAERNNIIVTHSLSAVNISAFIVLYNETVRRNKFEAKSNAYFNALFAMIKKYGCGDVFIASCNGSPLAAALVIFYGRRATYFFGASSSQKRQKMAPNLLHWEIIRHAQKHGFAWYDFWGVAPNKDDTEHGWYGLSQFKKKFGGTQFDYIGAYDFIYNEKLYREFLKESGELKMPHS